MPCDQTQNKILKEVEVLSEDIGLMGDFVHGAESENVTLGGKATPTIRHMVKDFQDGGNSLLAKATREADRAETAAKSIEATTGLGSFARNVRATKVTASALASGGTLTLPVSYYPKRDILYLSVDGMVCSPRKDGGEATGAYQYEEVGTDENKLSDKVKVYFAVDAGALVDAWVVASNLVKEMATLQASAADAAASATAAKASQTAAATSATNAASSASTAATKASDAATSSTAAKAAQTAAETAKSGADASKTAAATSAANAANSATAAAGSASTASTKASDAATSATAAKTAQTAAETAKSGADSSKTAAAASATAAAGSASTASTKASDAATSATAAKAAQTAAETAAANAQGVGIGKHALTHKTGGTDAIAPADIGAAPASHTSSLATASIAGHVKSGTGLGVDAAGVLSVSYGTAAGTACQGNDSRLSDARTPKAHTHAAADLPAPALSPAPVAADTNKKLLAAGAGAGKWVGNAALVSAADSGRAAIAVNGTYTVPSYVVGAGQLRVSLEGCECYPDEQYSEVGTAGAASTRIKWLCAVPTDYTIGVFVTP